MDEAFISQISRKRTPSGPTYSIRVPAEWAERMLRHGVNHVSVADAQGGFGDVVLTPLSDKTVKDYRAAKKRETARRNAQRRYYENRG